VSIRVIRAKKGNIGSTDFHPRTKPGFLKMGAELGYLFPYNTLKEFRFAANKTFRKGFLKFHKMLIIQVRVLLGFNLDLVPGFSHLSYDWISLHIRPP
jgi:hypothetical protein